MKQLIGIAAILLMTGMASCRPAAVVVRPQPVVYVRPAPPAPHYIWVEGRWVGNRRHGYYKQGYWVAPRRY